MNIIKTAAATVAACIAIVVGGAAVQSAAWGPASHMRGELVTLQAVSQ